MSEPRTIPRVPYGDDETPPWSPGFEEPGRTPEEERERRAEEQRQIDDGDKQEDL
jgi:hypothetical protein